VAETVYRVSANHLLTKGFGGNLEAHIEEWLGTNEDDGRREWLDD
jgi:hypothetical protein